MNAYEAYLMNKPSVPRQPYCPVCGKTAGATEHHIVARSQGGTEGPTYYPCGDGTTGCHGLAEAEMLHHDWDGERWLWCLTEYPEKDVNLHTRPGGAWKPFHLYDPNRDPEPWYDGGFDDAITAVHELLDTIAAADYYLGHALSNALRHGGKDAVQERLSDRVDPQSFGSWLSNRIAYSSLPETSDVLSLGVTHGVAVARMVKRGHSFSDLMQSYTSMPWLQFKAEYAHSARRNDGC